jgi:hypothetical protein
MSQSRPLRPRAAAHGSAGFSAPQRHRRCGRGRAPFRPLLRAAAAWPRMIVSCRRGLTLPSTGGLKHRRYESGDAQVEVRTFPVESTTATEHLHRTDAAGRGSLKISVPTGLQSRPGSGKLRSGLCAPPASRADQFNCRAMAVSPRQLPVTGQQRSV